MDTDILSEYFKGQNSRVADHAAGYVEEFGIFTFTSVTVHEIVYGLELKVAFAQLQKALRWLGQNEEVAPVKADYLTAATIKATARRRGFILELPDCLIASVAVRTWAAATGNTEDFRAIQRTRINLVIENWRDA